MGKYRMAYAMGAECRPSMTGISTTSMNGGFWHRKTGSTYAKKSVKNLPTQNELQTLLVARLPGYGLFLDVFEGNDVLAKVDLKLNDYFTYFGLSTL